MDNEVITLDSVTAAEVQLYAKDNVVKRLNQSVLLLKGDQWYKAIIQELQRITDEDAIKIRNRYKRKLG